MRDQRSEDKDESPIIHLPFLDDEWDNASAAEQSATAGSTVQAGESTDGTAEQLSTTDEATMDEAQARKKLTAEEEQRLASLKSMLDASAARYKQASRNRRPVFAAGLEIKVTQGEHCGKNGIVLDADYIENRALISLTDEQSPHWIGFRSLGHAN